MLWLRRLWERMISCYGHAWHSVQGIAPQDESGALTVAGDTWAKALAGLSARQLGAGLEACILEGEEFPPNAPRFRAMCLGIPPLARVRLEMTAPDAERSPFTRSVWMLIDGYAFRQASAQNSDRMLRDAYELAREQVMRGAALPGPSKAIASEQPRLPTLASDREARCEHLQHVLSKLGEEFNPAVLDPDYDPAKAHRSLITPEEKRAAEEALALRTRLEQDTEELP